MPNIITRTMPTVEGVVAGQTATCRLRTGLTFHQLLISYSGVTLAQMNEIRLIGNGKTIQRWVGGDLLDAVNTFEGRSAAAGVLTLDMDRYGLRTREGQEFTSIGTGHPKDPRPLSTLVLEIDIDVLAAAPVLSVSAKQSASRIRGVMKQVRQYSKNIAGTGEYEIADLPNLGVINRIVFDVSGTVAIDNVRIEADGFTIFDRSVAVNTVVQGDGVRVPNANYVVVDPTEDGNGIEGIEMDGVQDLRIFLNATATGPLPVTVEFVGDLKD